MNDRSGENAKSPKTPTRPITKAPYSAPRLRFFGNVAQLTQAATGCDNNDNKACAGINGRQNKN